MKIFVFGHVANLPHLRVDTTQLISMKFQLITWYIVVRVLLGIELRQFLERKGTYDPKFVVLIKCRVTTIGNLCTIVPDMHRKSDRPKFIPRHNRDPKNNPKNVFQILNIIQEHKPF